MIDTIVAVLVLAVGLFWAGMRASSNTTAKKDAKAMRKSKENHEKVSRMDDDSQLREFDRLRSKRR